MGSFNSVCIVSGLPIEHGTPVRFLALTMTRAEPNEQCCYVSGRWHLRSPPIQAKYNDYGSIERWKKNLSFRVFFESLNRDCDEKGVGDNEYHDVQVRPGMSVEDWLGALAKGRVAVWDQRPRGAPVRHTPNEEQVATGIPTLARIEAVLKDAGLPVVTDSGADGYLIDNLARGWVRVRHAAYQHEDETKLLEALPAIQAAGYAAMVTCGTGRYRNPAEVLVGARPGGDASLHVERIEGDSLRDKLNRPRPVVQAMIREDVWQILLSQTHDHWRWGEVTFQTMLADARLALADELEWRARKDGFNRETATEEERAAFLRDLTRRELRYDSKNQFDAATQKMERVSGFSLRESLGLAIEMSSDPAELDAFLVDLTETAFVQWSYDALHGQWHPTTNGSQDGNWKVHRSFLRALADIRGIYE